MKRVLRDVVLGAVSCVATIGAGSGVLMAAATGCARARRDGNADACAASGCTDARAASASAYTAAHARAGAAPGRNNWPTASRDAGADGMVPIQRIVVQGNQRIEPATVISYMLIHPGDTFDPERVDLSLKTLFADRLFADVQIEQRGTDLVCR